MEYHHWRFEERRYVLNHREALFYPTVIDTLDHLKYQEAQS